MRKDTKAIEAAMAAPLPEYLPFSTFHERNAASTVDTYIADLLTRGDDTGRKWKLVPVEATPQQVEKGAVNDVLMVEFYDPRHENDAALIAEDVGFTANATTVPSSAYSSSSTSLSATSSMKFSASVPDFNPPITSVHPADAKSVVSSCAASSVSTADFRWSV